MRMVATREQQAVAGDQMRMGATRKQQAVAGDEMQQEAALACRPLLRRGHQRGQQRQGDPPYLTPRAQRSRYLPCAFQGPLSSSS